MFSGGKGKKTGEKMNSYEAKQEMRRMRYREQADTEHNRLDLLSATLSP
jgi:hypothetical protein